MKSRISLLNQASFLAMLFLCCGCSHYYYASNQQTISLFKKKKDFIASAGVGTHSEGSSVEAQAAYAVGNHLAVATNFMYVKENHKNKNAAQAHYLEGSVGHFSSIYDKYIFEVYAGIGTGTQKHEYWTIPFVFTNDTAKYEGTSELHFNKFFVQPSLGYSWGNVDIAVSGRLSYISFDKVTNNIATTNSNFHEVGQIAQNNTSLLFEPALTMRAGWDNIKFQLQWQWTNNLSNPSLAFNKTTVGFGFVVTLPNQSKGVK